MTKVTILGQGEVKPREPRKIKFEHILTEMKNIVPANVNPNEWQNILLISQGYRFGGFDLMYAYDGDIRKGTSTSATSTTV